MSDEHHEPCCAKHATDHALRLIIISNLLTQERLSIMNATQDQIIADLGAVKEQQGRLITFVESFRTQLADLKATIQQQQLDAAAEKAILDAVDHIRDDSAAELAKIAADNAGTGTPIPAPQPAATVTQFKMSSPLDPIAADTLFSFTLSAADAQGNVVSTYLGTAHFTSDIGGQSVPNDDYTFVPSDNGVHTFQATFPAGTLTLTVTDVPSTGVTGTVVVVVVG